MLRTLLGQKIQVVDAIDSWEDAIRISAAPMLENGSIEPRYVEAMIEMCRQHNAYIVLADYFAMPHAAPHCGAVRMDAALTLVKSPVDFMGKPVRVLLAIASPDTNSHLEMLQGVSVIMGDDSKVEELVSAESAADIMRVINAALDAAE